MCQLRMLTPVMLPTSMQAHAATKEPKARDRTEKCVAKNVFVYDSGNTA